MVISIAVKVGSRNENKKNNGISHFIEHMSFKGTEKRNAKKIANDLENIGSSFNAYTSKESTVYYAKVLKEYAEDAFEILADMVLNSTFSKDELEKERLVILQEIAMTKDDPSDIISDYYFETAFSNQAFGRPILGSANNVKNFTREDLLKYHKKYYVAKNMNIVASGNITHEKLLNLVDKYIGNVDSGKIYNLEKAEYIGGYCTKNKSLEQNNCIIGFEGISYNNENKYKFHILNNILSTGMSSRIFQEIREKRGLCYEIISSNESTFETGSFEIFTATKPEKTNEAIVAILEELKNIVDNGITDEELERAKIKVKSALLMQDESIGYKNSLLLSNLLHGSKIITVHDICKDIENTTKNDVINILNNIIKSTPSLVVYGKVKNVIDYDNVKKIIK